jgi:hypothetical protein
MGGGNELLGALLILVLICLLMSVLLGIPRGLSARAETRLLAFAGAVLFSLGYILHA